MLHCWDDIVVNQYLKYACIAGLYLAGKNGGVNAIQLRHILAAKIMNAAGDSEHKSNLPQHIGKLAVHTAANILQPCFRTHGRRKVYLRARSTPGLVYCTAYDLQYFPIVGSYIKDSRRTEDDDILLRTSI